MTAPVYIALVHGPVKNKRGDLVTTAVTGLNLHDIARAVTTYGGAGYFLVTPLEAQQRLVARMRGHWEGEFGARYNPNRRQALAALSVVDTLKEAVAEIERREGAGPEVVATSARHMDGAPAVSFADQRARLDEGGRPLLLVFGTGWGLPDEVLCGMDRLLEPVRGAGDYNHLSVRSAVSIILDRLLGR